MKHAIILGHPSADSFAASVAATYRAAAEAAGHQVTLRDLYRMNFDPRLHDEEIPRQGVAPGADVAAERAEIADVDVFAFVYPLWFNAPPAVVVGYIQRVFGVGFGYAPGLMGNRPLLTGRKMVSFTSSGAPTEWLEKEGGWDALRTTFDTHIANVCGLHAIDHIHFGHVVQGAPPESIRAHLEDVAGHVTRLFPASLH